MSPETIFFTVRQIILLGTFCLFAKLLSNLSNLPKEENYKVTFELKFSVIKMQESFVKYGGIITLLS